MNGNLESLFREFEVEKLHLISIQGGVAKIMSKTGDATYWASPAGEGDPPIGMEDWIPDQICYASSVTYAESGHEVADDAIVMDGSV